MYSSKSRSMQNVSQKSKTGSDQSYFPDLNLSQENIVESLNKFPPSKELVDLLSRTILHYEKEYDSLKLMLDKYISISNERLKVETEGLVSEEKISSLLTALSQLQDCVLEERENTIQLELELENCKIEKEQTGQGIQHLLDTTDDGKLRDEIIYIFQEPYQLSISQRLLSTRSKDRINATKLANQRRPSENESGITQTTKVSTSNSSLRGDAIYRQNSLMKERIEAMKKDIEISQIETEQRQAKDADKIRKLTVDLNRTEKELKNCNNDLLDTKKCLYRAQVLAQAQFDEVLRSMKDVMDGFTGDEDARHVIKKVTEAVVNSAASLCIEQCAVDSTMKSQEGVDEVKITKKNKSKSPRCSEKEHGINVNVTQPQDVHKFYEARGIGCEFRDLYKKLEDELKFERTHREAYIAPFQIQNAQLISDLKVLKARLHKVEMYRKLQMEGFLTDFKNLTQKIQSMDKQLSKLMLLQVPSRRDEEYLETAHTTAKYSKRLSNELLRLKAKLYQVESNLRRL